MRVAAVIRAVSDNAKTFILKAWAEARRIGNRNLPYTWVAAVFQGITILGCEYLWLAGTHPGIAVAALAVAAVVMAFRATEKNFTKAEQAIWIILAATLFYVEINSIYDERAETLASELRIRAEERDRFEAVLNQGKRINQKQMQDGESQQQKFGSLLEQGKKATQELKGVAASAIEAQAYASGGTSYPTVFPYKATIEDGTERVGFGLQKQGQYPLFDVQVIVGRPYLVSEDGHQTQTFGTNRRFVELNGTATYPLLFASMRGEDRAIYSAILTARNGSWEEVIEARRVGENLVFRWVEYKSGQYGVTPLVKILDLAGQDFPAEFRHTEIYPLEKVTLPAIAERPKVNPDVIVPPR